MRPTEQWIWLDPALYPEKQTTIFSVSGDKANGNYTVAEFCREYEFPAPIESVKLRFTGDTVFFLWVNDIGVGTGPASVGGDFYNNRAMRPQHYADTVTLHPTGKKLWFTAEVRMMPVLMCEYSHGHGGFSLWAQVRLTDGTVRYLTTDETWLCRPIPAHVRPGFYDGRIPAPDFAPAAVVPNLWHAEDSPIPLREEKEIRPAEECVALAPGEIRDFTLELDRIYAAFPLAEVTAKGEVALQFRCFEQTDEGTAEECVFAGSGQYRSFRLHSVGGFRVHAENRSDCPAYVRLSAIATCYPVSVCAETKTSDEDLNRVLDVCRHTLQYCRQTLHLDSPRHCEPLACTGDYYIETLMTMYSFGDMGLASFDIRRTAELLRYNKGVMFHTTYSLIWVRMLWDVYRLTGDKALLEDCFEALTVLLTQFETYLVDNGLIDNPRDYMFVDWIYIDGISMHHPPKALGQTCLNAFYYGALTAAADICRELNETRLADRYEAQAAALKKAVNAILYDGERGLYFEGLNTPTAEERIARYMPQNVEKRYFLCHSNILCTCFGLCEGEDARRILRTVVNTDSLGKCQPYFAHFLLEAVYRHGLREELTRRILEDWKQPAKDCPKGLVEGFIMPEPTYSFDHSHAWGGTPLYSLPKALTGLEILEPGMTAVSLAPSLLGLEEAAVEVPTPLGMLTVHQKKGSAPEIDAPAGLRVELR